MRWVSSEGTIDGVPSATTDRGLAPERGNKDGPSVTAGGKRLVDNIDGVVTRRAVAHTDERGEVTELLSESWPELLDRIPHVYLTTIQPEVTKGWVCHKRQDDRSVVLFGRLRWVLYDGRSESPTHNLVQELTFTERNRHLIVVPAGVWHAVQNVGSTEAAFVNMPTCAYRHGDPDKYRLPLDTPEIPFQFASQR